MENERNASENIHNSPRKMDELAEELNSMSVEELKEELAILWSEMDEDSFDGELLEVYLDAIDRKSPQPRHMDTQAAYELFLKRLKDEAQGEKPRRGQHL